jgi:hypothetical protein
MICCDFIDASGKYEQDRNSMLRWCAFVVGVCLSASAVAHADASADQVQTSSDPEMEARFDLFRKTGDHARSSGRYNEAATAYKAALDIHLHPVIRGRLGLMLAKLGHLDKAAEELHEALEHGQGVTPQERREVTAAYDKAKALTTWVTVIISQTGAKITCDGEPWGREGFSSFWRFAMPGEHTLRATLDGYEEAVQTFTAKPGEEITVTLRLLPKPEIRPADQAERTIETLLQKKRRFPPQLHGSNIVGDPNYEQREDPNYGEPKEQKPEKKKTGPRFSVSGGVVTVFGVASWNPAVGGVVGVAVRPHENVSIGLEGRAAWLTTGVAGSSALTAMTAGGLLSACGHLRWFFGCGLGYVGTVNVSASSVTYKETKLSYVQPGAGLRLGAEFPFGSTFVARAGIDAMRLTYRIKIWVGNATLVDQPPMMFAGQVSGEWRF